MKHEFDTINYEWLTATTGDPFGDLGGYVIKELEANFPDKGILDLIEYVTNIYVNKWGAKINPFFLNSKITQPAFKPDKKISETLQYFASMINEKSYDAVGVCRITGHQGKLYMAGRDNSILSGSGTLINFHHSFESGIMLSKEMLIRFHFVPFGCEYLQGKIALIHSTNEVLGEFFARNNCVRNLHAIAGGISDGILKSESRSPGTALFRFIDNALVTKLGVLKDRNNSLALYHFTNFGASPEVIIYSIPDALFGFYHATQSPDFKEDWNSFIAGYYYSSDYKNTKYNRETHQLDYEKKGNIQNIPEDEYKYWSNTIYNKLLNRESILRNILRWSKENKFNLRIVEIYQIYLRNMKQETITKIKEMTDLIFKANDDNEIEKVVKKLSNAKNSYLLRRFIIKDIVAKYKPEDNKPIITVEEYANYLFPDTGAWQEVRDVLLISIYQRLHEQNKSINLPEDEEEAEEND